VIRYFLQRTLNIAATKFSMITLFTSDGIFGIVVFVYDGLCDQVARAPGYRSRYPGFDSRSYHIF
jgi:hypothetical protein